MLSQHASVPGLKPVAGEGIPAPCQACEIKNKDALQPNGAGVGLVAFAQQPFPLHTINSLTRQTHPNSAVTPGLYVTGYTYTKCALTEASMFL